MQLSNIIHLHL